MSKSREEIAKGINQAFYETSPKASEIRSVAIAAVLRIERLLHLDPQDDAVEIRTINSELEQLEEEFTRLGITRGMETGHDLVEYAADPVLAAQYVAGQIFSYFDNITNLPHEREAMSIAGEFDESDTPVAQTDEREGYLVDLRRTPNYLLEFLKARDAINLMLLQLDYSKDGEE